MRKLFTLALALCMVLSLAACGGNTGTPNSVDAPSQGTITPPPSDNGDTSSAPDVSQSVPSSAPDNTTPDTANGPQPLPPADAMGENTTFFTIQGRAVVQGETTGVEGAIVEIWYNVAYERPAGVEPSQQVTTDENGNYSISNVPGGGHYMEASKDGYVEAKITFGLDINNDPSNPVEMQDFKLTQLGGN